MEPVRHLDHLRADAAALAEAVRAAPDAPVDTCPGWDRRTLAAHLCVPYGWVTAQLAAGPEEKRGFRDAPRPGEGDDVVAFYEAAADRLLDALSRVDMASTWPTFVGPRPAAWFARRMAQETSVHRFDVAGGSVDADLAVDGIDELLDEFCPMLGADAFAGTASTLHLHATDHEEGEWLLTLGPTSLQAERTHGKGDAAIRGGAADLYLFAWNRVPLDDRFEVLGDRGAAERWTSTVRF